MGECCSRGSSRCQRDGEPPPVALEKGTGPEFRWREETQQGTETAPGLSEGARGGPGRTGTTWWGAGGASGDTRPRGTWAATSHLQSELGHVPHQPVPPRFLLGLRENHGGLRVGARAVPPPPLSGGEQVRAPAQVGHVHSSCLGSCPSARALPPRRLCPHATRLPSSPGASFCPTHLLLGKGAARAGPALGPNRNQPPVLAGAPLTRPVLPHCPPPAQARPP